jgi:hypothetical protein
MKFVKVISGVVLAFAVLAGVVWQVWLEEQVAFARAGTAYAAKQVCSCRHIGERDLTSCKGDFTVDLSPFTFEEDGERVRVSVLGGLVKAEAKFEDGLGCALVKP